MVTRSFFGFKSLLTNIMGPDACLGSVSKEVGIDDLPFVSVSLFQLHYGTGEVPHPVSLLQQPIVLTLKKSFEGRNIFTSAWLIIFKVGVSRKGGKFS